MGLILQDTWVTMLDDEGLIAARGIIGVVGIFHAAKGIKRDTAKAGQTSEPTPPKQPQTPPGFAGRIPTPTIPQTWVTEPVTDSSEPVYLDVSVSTAHRMRRMSIDHGISG
jgi:hypothetical protein